MDVRKKTPTPEELAIKYAVEYRQEDIYLLIRADYSYKRAGRTFSDLKEAKKYRDEQNDRIRNDKQPNSKK